MKLGIIGGTGTATLFGDGDWRPAGILRTPWGPASAPVLRRTTEGGEVFFLPRHGVPAELPPHRVNYRANVWAMREAGVEMVIGINAVGGISADAVPGRLVLPHQLIDYTWGRDHSYAGTASMGLRHVAFTEPFCVSVRARLLEAAAAAGQPVLTRGVYGVTQGPRLESAAEIDRLERDGCTVVGMTAMPEAGLARELDLPYAICCPVVNRAAGRGAGGIHAEMDRSLGAALASAKALLAAVVGAALS